MTYLLVLRNDEFIISIICVVLKSKNKLLDRREKNCIRIDILDGIIIFFHSAELIGDLICFRIE